MESIAPNDLGPIVSNEFGDHYLFSINRYTFRQTDAHTLYKKQYGDGIFQENTLHILVGMDSGLLLQYLHRIGISPTSRYVIVELPKTLERLRQEGLLDASHERVACVTVDELPAIAKKFEFANYLYTEKINIWKSFAALDAFLPEYGDLYWATRDFVDTFAWQIKVQLGNEIFIRRQLENLPENRHSAACLKNLFPGKTAVLLAGGPSLDDILPWVRENRQNLVVLAVSRIARRLKEVDLTPDIFFSVDPQEVSFDVSKEMLYFGDRTLFVNSYHVVPKLLSQWQGRSVFVGPRWPWEEESETYLEAPGPTVTNTAFATAISMGFKQIILGGVDLCYSPSGHSHAKGSYERQAGPKFNAFPIQVETNQKTKAFTTRTMAEAINYFGAKAACAKQVGCRTINPSPISAAIPNVEHRDLSDISLNPSTGSAWDIILNALPNENSASRLDYFDIIRKELHSAEKNICKIRKLAKEAIKCNLGLFGRNGRISDFNYKIRMDKIENSLHLPPLERYTKLLKEFGLFQFVKIVRPGSDQQWTDDQIEETGLMYYKAYCDSAEELLKQLNHAKQRLNLRIEEESPKADPAGLFSAWQKTDELGRALLWRQRHDTRLKTWSTEVQRNLEKFETRFEKNLTRRADNIHKTKGTADPEMARHCIRSLFKKADKITLTDLLKGLEESSEDTMTPVFHLSKGYLAELEQDFPKAMDEYRQVLELSHTPATEEALQRIASMSLYLQDHSNALLALQCLSGISPQYLPKYADLARLLGKTKSALDAYTDYLEFFPNDVETLFKVGKLYEQKGENDFAASVFTHIILKDPHNQAARNSLEGLTYRNSS